MSETDSLFVPSLQPALKHPVIFDRFDQLGAGETFVLINDHDPKPLYYQLLGERGNTFTWEYLENGPDWWHIRIGKNAKAETIGEMVARDIRKAEVFKKYGIDFCCGGRKTVQQACEENGLSLTAITAALAAPQERNSADQFHRWELDFLSDYIFNQHHLYYYEQAPVIRELLEKVNGRHGNAHPELGQLVSLFGELLSELEPHFLKEEKIVFPFIKSIVQAKRHADTGALQQVPSLSAPLEVMQADHDAAGALLDSIKHLTSNYNPPGDACNSYKFLFKKLEELDDDLRLHIHLENNILFPKALQLQRELLSEISKTLQ